MDSVPDAHHSGTTPLQAALGSSVTRSRLPCGEFLYESSIKENSGDFASPLGGIFGTPSISVFLIRMAMLRQKVLRYSSSFKMSVPRVAEIPSPWCEGSEFRNFKQKLDDFMIGLPAELRFNDETEFQRLPSNISLFTLHTMVVADTASSFVYTCKAQQLNHTFEMVETITKCLDVVPTEHDPFVAICSCLAIRIIVVERWNQGKELVSLEDKAIKEGLLKCLDYAKKTARWSTPIQKLLLAAVQLTYQHGFDLDMEEFKNPRSGILTCAAPEDAVLGVQQPNQPAIGGLGKVLLPDRYSLSPEALRIASSWADGTYGLEMAQTQFDWGTLDFGWGFAFDEMNPSNAQGPDGGMQFSFD
ncbi:Fc.00g104030.m01.CDS01 [Cosmosporella sp. VM-42]